MAKAKKLFSQHFGLRKSQAELDFVDVPLDGDIPLFLDPFALSRRTDRFSQECHRAIMAYFQALIDAIRAKREDRASELLRHLREPNETRFGFSKGQPKGAGIGQHQARQIFEALRDSSAVRTGFLSSLEECELMIEGISRDKVSDLTTNVLRGPLADYTQEQCKLHGVALRNIAMPPMFDSQALVWDSRYVDLPVADQKPVMLIPKALVRYDPAYDHAQYYRHFVLNYLKTEELDAHTGLVRILKNGNEVVYKKDVARKFPCTKEFLYNFSRENPEILEEYRENLRRFEDTDRRSDVDPADDVSIAKMLAAALRAIPAGGDAATLYHRLMVGVVEFIFHPQLLYPKKEQEIHAGRKRIDIVMENGARSGIFLTLSAIRRLPCAYIAFECKNYTTEVANPELDQLAGRFAPNRGLVGFLCCRRFEDRNLFLKRCQDTIRDSRGLIVPLDDATILRLLGLIEQQKREDLDAELSGLVAEVWAQA